MMQEQDQLEEEYRKFVVKYGEIIPFHLKKSFLSPPIKQKAVIPNKVSKLHQTHEFISIDSYKSIISLIIE